MVVVQYTTEPYYNIVLGALNPVEEFCFRTLDSNSSAIEGPLLLVDRPTISLAVLSAEGLLRALV